MKKKQKFLISIIVAIVVLAVLLSVFIPKIILHVMIEEALPWCQPTEYATDYTIKEENATTVGNDYFSIELPANVAEMAISENLNAVAYEVPGQEKAYIIKKEKQDMSMSLVDAADYEEGILKIVGPKKVEKSFEKLGFDTPDSFYHIMQTAYLLDATGYNFWSLENQLVYATAGTVRAELMDGGGNWLYERDGVRAIVQQIGNLYFVSIMKEEDLNTVYSFYVRNAMLEDVWKVLNSLEFY